MPIYQESTQQKPADDSAGFSYLHPQRGYLLFGTALPQQLLHPGQLFSGDILPLQQSRKQTDNIRLVGVGINRGGKILFSCERGRKGTSIGLTALHKTGFPDCAFLQQAVEQDVH